MTEYIGWIVEAKISEGKRAEFEAVMHEIVAETLKEGGTLNYQYFVSDEGDVLILERFATIESAHIHIDNWERFAERWLAGECKKICVTGILTNLLKGQQNAIIRRTHRSTAGGLLQP